MAGVRRDWVDEMGGLTAAGPDWPAATVAAATDDAARLAALARTLVDAGIVPAACDYPHGCALTEVLPGACELARALAETPSARARRPTTTPDPEAAVAAFLDALANAGSAIYVCRRVLHPTGRCLFVPDTAGVADTPGVRDPAAGADLCARLLLAAHRLGGAASRS